MADKLLKPIEVDILFGYPDGRTMRLVRKGKIPAVTLPDGSIRVKQSAIDKLVETLAATPQPAETPQSKPKSKQPKRELLGSNTQ